MASGGNKVVVIGGGIAGSFLAKSLQFDADVTLIDPKEYFEIQWANLRSMVEPSFAERSTIQHRDYFTNGHLIVSNAVNITDSNVLTADGRQVSYDYLVIATGHNDSYPRTRSERLKQYQGEYEKIKAARSILIVGGGPTGVELAGEIAVDFPDKKVTLVHKGSRLMQFIGSKASKKALNWLRSKNVEVKLGQTVNVDTSKTYVTSAGETIQADCHFICTGIPLASGWLKETGLKDSVDNLGRIKVDEKLRVRGRRNIFAIGDITDVQEIKQGFLAQRHSEVVAKNIKILMNGGNESKMATYKPASAMALVSLGRREGVAQFPFMTISGRIPGYIKSGDLFVGKTRKTWGLKA